jgi:exopolysaccharide production protein ExoY
MLEKLVTGREPDTGQKPVSGHGGTQSVHRTTARIDPSEVGLPGTLPYLALRVFECTVALIALVISLPVCLIIAAIIRLDSPGPALFVQRRLGKGAQTFRFVKFRTMYVDARTRFPELYKYQYDGTEINVIRFKVKDDPRLTRFGRWLRQTSLDELPNFWNVLTGDMALVGPRPEIPEMLPYYGGGDQMKFAVRPGVTGLAQTAGRGHLTFRDTVRLDVEYVKTRSFKVDMQLMLKTLKMVVASDGAF